MQQLGVSAIHPQAPHIFSAWALFTAPVDLNDAINRLNAIWKVGVSPQWAEIPFEHPQTLMHFSIEGIHVMLSLVNEPLQPAQGILPEHTHYVAITLYAPESENSSSTTNTPATPVTPTSSNETAANTRDSSQPTRIETTRRRHALTAHIILTQLAHALLQAPGAIGLYRAELGVLQPPEMLNELAPLLGQGQIPLPLWINIRLQTHDLTVGRTLGLPLFGHLDVEVLESTHSAESVYSELANIASYIITSDNYLLPSQTISVADGEQIPVTQSISPLDKSPVIRIMY